MFDQTQSAHCDIIFPTIVRTVFPVRSTVWGPVRSSVQYDFPITNGLLRQCGAAVLQSYHILYGTKYDTRVSVRYQIRHAGGGGGVSPYPHEVPAQP